MDKFKSVAKGGWHPSGDKSIHRETWKSDLKGIATGKKTDPYEAARNHQSTPLSSLKDPDSFGPPPRQIPNSQGGVPSQALSTVSRPTAAPGGLGARVPAPAPRQSEQEVEVAKPVVPYRTDTTGLRTDNLPKPPTRSAIGAVSSPKTASPVSLPPRQPPVSLPPRQTTGVISAGVPPPILPPRQSSALAEHTTTPPPAYTTAQANRAAGLVSANQQAASALARAGISAATQSNRNTPLSPVNQQNQQASNLARVGISAAAANPQAASNFARAGLSAAAAHPQAASHVARAGLSAAAANPQAVSSVARAGVSAATPSNRNVSLVPVSQQAQQSASNLARAGISVPALGIDTTAGATSGRPAAGASQVNELQQRFARMNASTSASPVSPVPTNLVAAAAQKKPAPPPPPKKTVLHAADAASAPPPIPLSSKPRP